MIALFAAVALANGQSTHIWITREALAQLPEGELKSTLADPAVERALIAGTMFPDGGYAVDHPYGEAAHWEPFHDAYLAWIAETWDAPFAGEAALHVAFLFGLASHGMADETFDAHYFSWSRETDAAYGWAAGESFDEASDVIWCSSHGAQEVPADPFVPYDVFVPLYAGLGIAVDAPTMEDGFDALVLAVGFVGLLSTSPDAVADYEAQFPWGGAHLDEPALPGTPADEARWVAAHWQALWERLHDRAPPAYVIGQVPEPDAQWDWARDPESERSAVSVIVARGLEDAAVSADDFTVRTSDGAPIAVSADVYYGQDSHVIRLFPVEEWPLGDLSATLNAGFDAATDGSVLAEDFTWTFSTLPRPPDPDPDPEPEPEAEPERGCRHAPGAAWAATSLPLLARRRRNR